MEKFVQLISGGLEFQDPLFSLTLAHQLTAPHIHSFSLFPSACVFPGALDMYFQDNSGDKVILSLWCLSCEVLKG